MQKRVKIVLAVVLVALAGLILWQLIAVREPVYRGKPLRYWLNDYGTVTSLVSERSWQKKQADEAVRHMVTWTTNLPAPVVINGQFTVTNPISGTQQFFRLSQ